LGRAGQRFQFGQGQSRTNVIVERIDDLAAHAPQSSEERSCHSGFYVYEHETLVVRGYARLQSVDAFGHYLVAAHLERLQEVRIDLLLCGRPRLFFLEQRLDLPGRCVLYSKGLGCELLLGAGVNCNGFVGNYSQTTGQPGQGD
jgi:hypothetical protein